MITLKCQGLLFDLDGTLVDSLPAVTRAWHAWAQTHSLDRDSLMEQIHGRRSIDSIRRLLPHVDAEVEDEKIRLLESTDTVGVSALPGAIELLSKLPRARWGIVTSGTSDVARARMNACGLPEPGITVFGEEVRLGKPAPDPYALGAARLGIEPSQIIAFEDTTAGQHSIRAAGILDVMIGLPGTYRLTDYRRVMVEVTPEELCLHLPETARQ